MSTMDASLSWSGMRIATMGVSVKFDVEAEMRDGTVLRANVYRPSGDGPWPVLLTRLPYGKDFPTDRFDPVQMARRGYIVVVQDTRGRFASDGDWEPMVHEADDGHDTVRWAARLEGSDGQVGMYGGSYLGFTQWAAASRQPPALKAMAPLVTWSEPFDGLVYRGGAFELGLQAGWHLMMGMDVLARRPWEDRRQLGAALAALVRDYDHLAVDGYRSLPLATFAPHHRHRVAPAFFHALDNPMDAAHPAAAAAMVRGWHDRVQVPTLNVGGWYDIFLSCTIANYRTMRALGRPARLLLGPWSHGAFENPVGEINFGMGAQAGFIDLQTDIVSLQLRWFDHWLKGIDSGMLDEPPVRIFVMGANRWRDEEDWPLERSEVVPHYLHAGGRLDRQSPGDERPDRFRYDPADPVPTLGGATLLTPEFRSGPYDQRPIETRDDVLTYTTEPLEQDLEVTGPVEVRLWAASSAPDTDFVARLCDVFPDGRSINLTDGIVRARYRDWRAGAAPSLIEPRRPYEYVIDLWATSNVFRAGHRIRLQVTSSCFPRWDRNPNTGHEIGEDDQLAIAGQLVLHDREHPSSVLLPVVPA
jgi:uncharacterized protein